MRGGPGAKGGIAVLALEGGALKLDRVLSLDNDAAGMALTHDGRVLAVAAIKTVLLFDVAKLLAGERQPELTRFANREGVLNISVAITADDRTLFVSEEQAEAIAVYDLVKLRKDGYSDSAGLGKVPTGHGPISLVFSPDQKWLYSTFQIALPEWRFPRDVPNPRDANARMFQGGIALIDVAKSRTDAAHAVVARVPAGGTPVRLVLSENGERVFTTARASNQLVMLDAKMMRTDPERAKVGVVTVGSAPVPLVLFDGGRKVLVGNSNRFADNAASPSNLTVVDVEKMGEGDAAATGTITAGAFPRDLALLPDGHTILVANFLTRDVQVLDARNLPLK
jgi:hypothetical protein